MKNLNKLIEDKIYDNTLSRCNIPKLIDDGQISENNLTYQYLIMEYIEMSIDEYH